MELLALSQQLDDAKFSYRAPLDMAPEVQSAISGATYIAQHLKDEDAFNRVGDIHICTFARSNSFRRFGRNPWLCSAWSDVHFILLAYACVLPNSTFFFGEAVVVLS